MDSTHLNTVQAQVMGGQGLRTRFVTHAIWKFWNHKTGIVKNPELCGEKKNP